MTNTLKLMKEVAALRKSIAEKSTAELLQKQGLQYNLKEMYKPITETQVTSTSGLKKGIIDKIIEVSNANDKQFDSFKEHFSELPNLIKNVEDMKNDLVDRTNAIIEDIKDGNSNATEKIEELIETQGKFEEILHSYQPDPVVAEYVKIISKHPGVKNFVVSKGDDKPASPTAEEKNIITGFNDLTYDQQNNIRSYLLLVPENQPIPPVSEALKNIDFSGTVYPEEVLSLLDFIDENKTNLKTDQYFKQIKTSSPQIYDILTVYKKGNRSVRVTTRDNLKKVQQNTMSADEFVNWLQQSNTKKGSGIEIEYLPSDVDELSQELTRLIGSYKSGNKNTTTYNKINEIVDVLRRKSVLDIDEIKDLYMKLSD